MPSPESCVAEFISTYSGYSCQEVTQDFSKAFEATVKCCKDFDWDRESRKVVAKNPKGLPSRWKYFRTVLASLDKGYP